ncbi:hypothetical protein [Listeria booriae]|uniref:hypothetical protein n=1 Tax=Listeria booriae TaxID=1552123 RepID=UPI001628BDA3|nr:hypothetical protein [Listeria booriae]MBC1524459.1 hypothetical protein [Listeria booriae]MBC6306437.1 hypothetical protein [Listeria booriae]
MSEKITVIEIREALKIAKAIIPVMTKQELVILMGAFSVTLERCEKEGRNDKA